MVTEKLTDARILIVDDQAANVLLLRELLEEEGYTNLESTTDPRRTLEIFGEFEPDLILLDLHMPHLDGFALLEKLREVISPQCYLPILVLTADVTQPAKQRALTLGARDFLTKPLDHIEVLLRIRNLLETRALHLLQQRHNQGLEEKVRERTAQLHRQTAHAQALTRIAARLNADLDLPSILDAVCEETVQTLQVSLAAVSLFDPERQVFDFAAGHGPAMTGGRERAIFPLEDEGPPPTEWEPGDEGDAAGGDGGPRLPAAGIDLRTTISLPMRHAGQLIGRLDIGVAEAVRHFDSEELVLLQGLADQAAQAIVNARLVLNLQEYSALLEERVAERTAALRNANSQLQRVNEEVSHALEKEKELSELKSRFLSIASHEFRTPLAVILSSAHMLERYQNRLSEDNQQKHLHRIQSSVRQMTDLVDGVLQVEKGRAGRMQFDPAPLDLERFCRDLIEEFRLGAGARHQISLDLAGAQPLAGRLAVMDIGLLHHILRNLLSNAIKYSPEGSPVTLTLSARGGQVRFAVRDRGIGIPTQDQARLFEFFHRAGNVGTVAGTGLGLYIVKQAVDRHGGTIQFTSQEGDGTEFTVALPLAAETEGV